jgi:hypothetical protein
MRNGTSTARPVLRDTLLALLVLALTFLNFGHSSAVFAAGGRVVVTGISICGEQNAATPGDHFACHACRHNVASLPPAPVTFIQIVHGVVPAVFTAIAMVAATAPVMGMPRPRGPPAI